MQYLVGEGHDIALVSLVTIAPQPRCEGLRYGRTTFAASGAVTREAAHAILIWDVIGTQEEYEDLLEQFGLDALVSANVTVTLPNALYTSTRYNGRAVRPAAGEGVQHSQYFLRDVQIVIKDLVVAS